MGKKYDSGPFVEPRENHARVVMTAGATPAHKMTDPD
jgi:hypothetical protein